MHFSAQTLPWKVLKGFYCKIGKESDCHILCALGLVCLDTWLQFLLLFVIFNFKGFKFLPSISFGKILSFNFVILPYFHLVAVVQLRKNSWSPPLVVSGLGLDVSFVILDEQIKASKKEEIDAESNKIGPKSYSSSSVSSIDLLKPFK